MDIWEILKTFSIKSITNKWTLSALIVLGVIGLIELILNLKIFSRLGETFTFIVIITIVVAVFYILRLILFRTIDNPTNIDNNIKKKSSIVDFLKKIPEVTATKYGENGKITKKGKIVSLSLDNQNDFPFDELASLVSLEELIITNCNQVNTESFLPKLTELTFLAIRECNLEKIDLSQLKKLKNLDLCKNQISKFPQLPKEIESVLIDSNNLTNIQIEGYKTLKVLWVGNNPIKDLKLNNLPKLESLALEKTDRENISDLSNLKSLLYLYLNGNKIKDVSPLKNLTKLNELLLKGNEINNINELHELAKTTFIDFDYEYMEKIITQAQKEKIKKLIADNKIAKAFKELEAILGSTNDILIKLKNRFNSLSTKVIEGTIFNSDENVFKAQIIGNLLDFVDMIGIIIPKQEPKQEPNQNSEPNPEQNPEQNERNLILVYAAPNDHIIKEKIIKQLGLLEGIVNGFSKNLIWAINPGRNDMNKLSQTKYAVVLLSQSYMNSYETYKKDLEEMIKNNLIGVVPFVVDSIGEELLFYKSYNKSNQENYKEADEDTKKEQIAKLFQDIKNLLNGQ